MTHNRSASSSSSRLAGPRKPNHLTPPGPVLSDPPSPDSPSAPPHDHRRSQSVSVLSDRSDESVSSQASHLSLDSQCGLKRQAHIRRPQKQRARPLPPRPLHWVEPPPPVPAQKVRRLPVLPVPISPFPPTCQTPPPKHQPTQHYSTQEVIDWDMISAIMSSAP